jgi:hypothetical protein
MTEQWEKWHITDDLSAKYYIESIDDTLWDLKFLLIDQDDCNKKILLRIGQPVDCYRVSDVNLQKVLLQNIAVQLGSNVPETWSFLKVHNSSYVQWFLEDSSAWGEMFNFQHFVFLGSNVLVDVLIDVAYWKGPEIEFI